MVLAFQPLKISFFIHHCLLTFFTKKIPLYQIILSFVLLLLIAELMSFMQEKSFLLFLPHKYYRSFRFIQCLNNLFLKIRNHQFLLNLRILNLDRVRNHHQKYYFLYHRFFPPIPQISQISVIKYLLVERDQRTNQVQPLVHLKSSINLEVNQLIKIVHCFIKLIVIIRVSSFRVAFIIYAFEG